MKYKNKKKTVIFTKTALSLLISISIIICNTHVCTYVSGQQKSLIPIPVISNTNTNTDTNADSASKEPTQTGVSVLAKAAVLIENHSGRILFEKDKDKELVPASITKIMTLLLIFEALHDKKITLEDNVSTSEYAASMGGSQVF